MLMCKLRVACSSLVLFVACSANEHAASASRSTNEVDAPVDAERARDPIVAPCLVFFDLPVVDPTGETLAAIDFSGFEQTHSTLIADVGFAGPGGFVSSIPAGALVPVARAEVWRVTDASTLHVELQYRTPDGGSDAKTIAHLALAETVELPRETEVELHVAPRRHGELIVFARTVASNEVLPLRVERSSFELAALREVPDLAACDVSEPDCFQVRLRALRQGSAR